MNPVNIQKAVNGYIVNVGCKTFVFTEVDGMIADLSGYLEDPQKMVQEYCSRYGEAALLGYEEANAPQLQGTIRPANPY